ncbi:hypothetical protein EPICR_170059 [Candidatus Desulfarcum epimagneticum]|uniref:Uncharacterized protein n=1 Tax=uncultured Desulfobacteraceae bacterium TaxID=218296 RepID=A0A484HIL7_9BACT|nr:hypothetical protein EPICR_170059 [uncultured Desulfobacteraceae bacterium]
MEESGDCVEPEGLYGTYINSKIASKLPPVSPCRINGMDVLSLREPDGMLSALYGNDFLKPDRLWINGKWVKTN